MRHFYLLKIISTLFVFMYSFSSLAQYQMENLDRGVVAVSMGGSKVFVSWRWLGTEPDNITFNLYRNGVKVNTTPLTVTNYTDNSGSTSASYTVRAVINGVEQPASKAATPWGQQYFKIPIQAPAGGTSQDGVAYTYNANDASIADLDGDGQWEIILKWDPSNSKDNSQSGYTGNTYVDAYRMNGSRMWRIDFGINIRSGAHYMDFMVYDFDGDGKAEMMCKTGDGTIDGTGKVIGNASADYRNSSGYVLSGPEYISVFNGMTGAAMATASYIPARGTVSSWGDSYGNRVDRFRAGVAYLDGVHPTGIFCRGYYTRVAVVAWDWKGGKLTNRWTFDTGNNSSDPYYSQGDHSLSIADVDDDGKQEIIVGSAIIDDNGTGYYSTTFGHGDALHVSDLDPDLPGLEVFNIQERVDVEGAYMYNAKSKKVLWTKPTTSPSSGEGPGRGVSGDISAAYRGAEAWAVGGGVTGLFDCKGNVTGLATPSTCNFLVWWDGDLLRELLNSTMIDKYGSGRMLTANNIVSIASNNGTKSNPCLSGDFFGDWREEVMWRSSSNDALYIFTTDIPTTYKFRTLLHDPQYRVAIAWQNTGYNQPPHVSFYLGDGMATPPAPNISIVGQSTVNQAPTVSITAPANNTVYTAPASITLTAAATDTDGTIAQVAFYNGTTLLGTDASSPYSYTWTNVASGTYTITAVATDNQGATTTSASIIIKVNAAPVVSITAPTNNTVYTAPAGITLTATATDTDGTVTQVAFYNGTTLLGTDASSPYSYSWTNVASGTYTITAVATDNQGSTTTSAPITIKVNAAPAISITAPTNNTVYTAPAGITLTATATDTDGTVTQVAFYNGTTLLGTDASSPYSYSWTNVASGTYTITAVATDNQGSTTTSSPITIKVNTAPTVSITAPGNNTVFTAPGSIPLTATATDTDGTVTQVVFYNGTTLLGTDVSSPYTYNWTNVASGTYTITAVATDNQGATTTSAPITIKVNTAPTVSITAPGNNTVFTAPGSIPLTATATDTDGTISQVVFYNGTTLLGTDVSSPYTYNWTNVASGSYTITAVATDNQGATTTSSPITIKVNTAPTVNITAPENNTVYTAPANITLTAIADDPDGVITEVAFYNGTALLGKDNTSPFSYDWTGAGSGTYLITAVATDDEGAAATSSAVAIEVRNNQSPVVLITAPVWNAVFTAPATIQVSATASDADGTITRVSFYKDTTLIGTAGTAPYSITLTGVTEGTYTLTAVATDDKGDKTTSENVVISVKSNMPPQIVITDPSGGTTYTAPASLDVVGDASDTDGTISSVAFYAGSTLIGIANTVPYQVPWANVPAGVYELHAVAIDNKGAQTTSSLVQVTVSNVSGVVSAKDANHLLVVPNPFSNSAAVRMDKPERILSVKLYDMQGKEILVSGDMQGNEIQFGADLQAGMYFMIVLTDSNVYVQNVLKR